MRQSTIETIKRLNDEHIQVYLGTQDNVLPINPPNSSIPHLDTNNKLSYSLEYFDLMTVTLLVNKLPSVTSHISANLASLIMRLACDGIVQGGILPEKTAEELTTAVMYNTKPNPMQLYQYLNFILTYEHTVLPDWFYYTLLMWVYCNSEASVDDIEVDKLYVWMIHNHNLIKFSDYNDDRRHDALKVKNKFVRIIKIWLKNSENMEQDESIYYILDMLRTTSTIILATLISRSCKWATLKEVGSEMLGYQLTKYQTKVNKNYVHLKR